MAASERKKHTEEFEALSSEVYRENKAYDLGLINVYAYHCNRCNYVWLPRDFDIDLKEPFRGESAKWPNWGQDLFCREPPKSCARCKSKYWKSIFMQRKSKTACIDEQKYILKQTSIARQNALDRVWCKNNPEGAKEVDKMVKSMLRKEAYRKRKERKEKTLL